MSKIAAEAKEALLEVYRLHGPRGNNFRVLPPSRYAKMSREQIDAKWDFPDRFMMHRVAKAIVALTG